MVLDKAASQRALSLEQFQWSLCVCVRARAQWLGGTEHCSLELKGSQMSLGACAKPAEKWNHRLFILHSSQTTISDGGEDTGQSNKTRFKMLPPDKSNLFF